jgi:hypothetical protein
MNTTEINNAFLTTLLAEDEVGRVIRSHLYVEIQINRYLELAVVETSYLKEMDLSYSKKIDLIISLGFDSKFRAALKKLGKIRNDFAHNISAKLNNDNVNEIYNLMPEFGKLAVKRAIKYLGQKYNDIQYNKLPTNIRFALVVLVLERVCCAACDLIQNAKIKNG